MTFSTVFAARVNSTRTPYFVKNFSRLYIYIYILSPKFFIAFLCISDNSKTKILDFLYEKIFDLANSRLIFDLFRVFSSFYKFDFFHFCFRVILTRGFDFGEVFEQCIQELR